MSSLRTNSRKKLLPKSPSKVLKKCKTFVTYSRRDYGLTNDQQLWARSLALSLSGWRDRQTFLKAQLEGHIKDKDYREAREVSQKAALKVQKDKRQTELAKQQAKVLKKHTKQTAGAYQDNVDSTTENELYDEENGCDYVSELEDVATSAEEERPNFEDMYGLAFESKSVVSSGAEHPRNPSITTFQPTANLRLQSNVPAGAVVDWRVKAHNGITKKKLSMGKRWSAVTWNQKSNVHERLLLLEYDGFDISELQNHKIGSEEITAIILERISAHQMPQKVEMSAQKTERPDSLPEECQDFAGLRQSDIITSTSPKNRRRLKAQSSAKLFPTPFSQVALVSTSQYEMTSTTEEGIAPFTLDNSYQPRPSPRLKRKRDFGDSDESAAASPPAFKKRKIKIVTKDELQPNALQEIKRKVLRRIFRPVRSVCRKPSASSRVIFSKNQAHTNQRAGKSISTLDYLYTRQPIATSIGESLVISSQGYDNMIAEIRFLTNTSAEKDDGISIYNPDYDGVPSHMGNRTQKSMENFFHQKSCIMISKDQQGHPVFQGDTLTLAELLKVLRERELLHRVDWKWEGIHLCPSSSSLWSLSPETQNALAEVERRLRQHARTGGLEIVINRVEKEWNS